MELCFVFLRTCIRYHAFLFKSSIFLFFLNIFFCFHFIHIFRISGHSIFMTASVTFDHCGRINTDQGGKIMTTLKCSATTCMYNKEQLCSKGDIDVTGENATTANETSCGSFRERSGNSVTNSYASGCGCEKIQIDCKAHNCTYNSDCKCTASSIHVDGSSAHDASDTKCNTFQCSCGV